MKLNKTPGVRFVMVCVAFILAANLPALDCWTALAMVESGEHDSAVGRHGEISRHQILPAFWRSGNPLDSRVAQFERVHRRAPSDFEFYVLWNTPAQIKHPHRAVAERARRFMNLTEDMVSQNQAFTYTYASR